MVGILGTSGVELVIYPQSCFAYNLIHALSQSCILESVEGVVQTAILPHAQEELQLPSECIHSIFPITPR
jgi:hypothetical protein